MRATKRAREIKARTWKPKQHFTVSSLQLKSLATKWAIRGECLTHLSKESYTSSIIEKPEAINKQDKHTDIQYDNEQTVGIAQKPFNVWCQGVCDDQYDE
jgi:hypothetical protein